MPPARQCIRGGRQAMPARTHPGDAARDRRDRGHNRVVTFRRSAPSNRTYIDDVAKAIPADPTIGMLAATHAGFRAVFETLGLDYVCAGHLSLDDAARGAGVDPSRVRAALQRVADQDGGPNWLDRPLRELIDHLDREHHQLLRNSVFQTAVLLDEALGRHGDACVGPLRHDFRLFSEQLLQHIEHEEVSLFPIAVALDEAWSKGEPLLADMAKVRLLVGDLVLQEATLAQRLDAVVTRRAAIEEKDDVECKRILKNIDSIIVHVHAYLNLENQIVFPRVLALSEQEGEHESRHDRRRTPTSGAPSVA